MYKFIFTDHLPVVSNDKFIFRKLNLRPVRVMKRSDLTGKFVRITKREFVRS